MENYNEMLSGLENRLKEAIEKRVKALNIREDRVKKILNKEYSYITTSTWNTKKRKVKTGLGIQGRENGKMVYLKLTTKENLFDTMKELVNLYKTYKYLDNMKDTLKILKLQSKN